MGSKVISENSAIRIQLGSLMIALVFFFGVAVSVGSLLKDQAQAQSDIHSLQTSVDDINKERSQNLLKLYGVISEQNERLARVEAKIDQLNRRR